MFFNTLLLAFAISGCHAAIPNKPGYTLVWGDDFNGPAGGAVNSNNWLHATPATNANFGEVQKYTASTINSRLSGDGALQIIPVKSSSGQWTSARLEGKRDFTCPIGKKMIVTALIRNGLGTQTEAQQKGLWPAFWTLGSSNRRASNPIQWPKCGEWDIFEAINGVNTNYGVLHCDVAPGGRCNEYNGLGATRAFSGGQLHRYSIVVDRTLTNPADWQRQTLTWFLDGVQYKQVSGKDVGDYNTWVAVARSPVHIIMNVAVGGGFPGQPTAQTLGGPAAAMYVHYVAVYNSV